MIGRSPDPMDQSQLVYLCRDREVTMHQEAIARRNSILEDIEANGKFIPSAEATFGKLPYDIWFQILRDFREPDEIKKLWQVSESFRQVLEMRYKEVLFAEIFMILLDKRPHYFFPDSITTEEGEKERVISLVLNLRFLSKLCKRSVEEAFFSDSNLLTYLSFRAVGKPRRASADLVANPFQVPTFFPGSIQVLDQDVPFLEFHQAITDFLGVAGTRVHCFCYVTKQHGRGMIYNSLHSWAGLMPNLKRLSVRCAKYNVIQNTPLLGAGEIQAFPVCPSLWSYEDEWVLSIPYIKRILDSCVNITELLILQDLAKMEHSPQVLAAYPTDKLTNLQVGPDLSFFSNHRLTWKLNRLILTNPYREGGYNLTVSSAKLFPFLWQFEETLEDLEVFIDVTNYEGEFYLGLRNLKTLKWKQHVSFDNVNFLLYTEKLEELYFQVSPETLEQSYSRIAGNLDGSFLGISVLEVLPYLKDIYVVA